MLAKLNPQEEFSTPSAQNGLPLALDPMAPPQLSLQLLTECSWGPAGGQVLGLLVGAGVPPLQGHLL